jgi:hypothetical protein
MFQMKKIKLKIRWNGGIAKPVVEWTQTWRIHCWVQSGEVLKIIPSKQIFEKEKLS